MEQYRLENDTFIIEEFDKKPTFCSFLPGLAGEKGIPLWSFYVNRGQCITSFGYNNKDNPIMEFFPANTAYENTTLKGFRTFVRKNGEYFEPFFATAKSGVKRTMFIRQNSLKIEETDSVHQLKTTVTYFILPNEPLGAMVRSVKFENLGNTADFEIIDGMPKIIACGMKGGDFARMTYLMKSYFSMLNIENKIPVFLNQITGDDADEVKTRAGGYFYMTFNKNGLVEPIYDPIAIFGEETSLVSPLSFEQGGLSAVENYCQVGINKIMCAFSKGRASLKKGETYEITTLVGYTANCGIINKKSADFLKPNYIEKKLCEANALTVRLTDDIGSNSGSPLMDMYARQSYLDNFLRGGYPYVFGDKTVHIFSRKHGDPERDYNFFSIAAEYYSQGDGNFRDVVQNRRNDVIFHPECNDFDIKMFFSLIQFDGYNPLFIKGTTFSVKQGNEQKAKQILNNYVNCSDAESLIEGKFTAGSLINGIYNMGLSLEFDDSKLLNEILALCDQNIEASTDKYGYWSDHWDYNLDLIDAYLKIYPDKLSQLLFENKDYTYFDSDVFVRPRSEKYFYDGKKVRQFKTYGVAEDKYQRGYIKNGTNWLKTASGEIYKTNLMEKLISLCTNKFALLDQGSMGIEMEVGKAGWCDSCNGLPSVLGSGMSETFELKRLLKFVICCCKKFAQETVELPTELLNFIIEIEKTVDEKSLSTFEYWDKIATAREAFREQTKYEISGKTAIISLCDVKQVFDKFASKVDFGIEKAIKLGNGLCPTYFRYNATKFDVLETKEGNSYPFARVHEFEPEVVPYFLEGAAKHMTNAQSTNEAMDIFNRVKVSEMYDKKLKMYKTSVSLENESFEIGRLRAFTPGWQERESVFLHMEYKYILSMLDAGIYDTFFEQLKNVYIPFQKPEIYGRSIIENSSFIASAVNPDQTLHGRGYMARLSGSATEVVSIWTEMFLGKTPFVFENGKLGLHINPVLPSWMFDENGEASFKFLSNCDVVLHNPQKTATYKTKISSVCINGKTFCGDTVFDDAVCKIRNGEYAKIEIFY